MTAKIGLDCKLLRIRLLIESRPLTGSRIAMDAPVKVCALAMCRSWNGKPRLKLINGLAYTAPNDFFRD
jgi:hypothetical protein